VNQIFQVQQTQWG